ncbi:hypothetical protein [Microbacterium hominis]|uniref:hypothetical protein n=1 Tax=Microbacterium hominis TaxID=162426 RepID=UPI0007685BDF|nr:hypothetical protein [Microbacterium hominis]
MGDLLFRWMSEVGSGTITDVRTRIDWIARTTNIEPRRHTSGRWLRDLSSLGHCEVDWDGGRWSVAPPALVRLPSAGGLAVIAGARRPRMMRILEDFCGWLPAARREPPEGEVPLPITFYMQHTRESDLVDAADATGLTLAGQAAERIARTLPPTRPHVLTGPPAFAAQLKRLDSMHPRFWQSVSAAQANHPDGLYSEQVNGRARHITRRSGEWFACDLSTGTFAELARRHESALRWRADTGREAAGTGTLFVDWGAPLPALHSRALVLCTGLPPRFGATATTAMYENVPRDVAARVSTSLGQTLATD